MKNQYIELYEQCRPLIREHSADVMNNARDIAFEDFKRLGIPSKKIERYKYTDMKKLFEPDYGLNLKRLDIPVTLTTHSDAMCLTSARRFISL